MPPLSSQARSSAPSSTTCERAKTGDAYMLYALSGAPKEAFANFPHPRATEIFAPTFNGEGPVRLADVTEDPRYGHNAPYFGMPAGHLTCAATLPFQ